MGTTIYGSYDHLVVELGRLERMRLGRPSIRLSIDDITAVRCTGRTVPADVHVGARWLPVVLIELRDGSRYAVHAQDAEDLARDLRTSGVGALVAA